MGPIHPSPCLASVPGQRPRRTSTRCACSGARGRPRWSTWRLSGRWIPMGTGISPTTSMWSTSPSARPTVAPAIRHRWRPTTLRWPGSWWLRRRATTVTATSSPGALDPRAGPSASLPLRTTASSGWASGCSLRLRSPVRTTPGRPASAPSYPSRASMRRQRWPSRETRAPRSPIRPRRWTGGSCSSNVGTACP